jgi:hypothetical protein
VEKHRLYVWQGCLTPPSRWAVVGVCFIPEIRVKPGPIAERGVQSPEQKNGYNGYTDCADFRGLNSQGKCDPVGDWWLVIDDS